MATAKTAQGYSNSNQISIQYVYLSLPDGSNKKLDIKNLFEELVLYEDIFEASMTGVMTIVDQHNLVGELPIVGGETIEISYKTVSYSDWVTLKFVVYHVGDRITQPNTNAQMNELYLCTPEMYWSVNNDISQSFKGTYKDIAAAILKLFPNGKKAQDFDATTGITTFIAPNWNMFKALRWVSARSYDTNLSPFLFYEAIDGYHLKSLKTLYDAKPFKNIYLQTRTMQGFGGNFDKLLNTAYSWEYVDSNDRLEQYKNAYFGTDYIEMNLKDKQFTKKTFDYTKNFSTNKVHINPYPLPDDMVKQRNKSDMVFQRTDSSQNAYFQKKSAIGLLDNTRIKVAIPGDSHFTVGKAIKMDVPSKVGPVQKNEDIVSGKWLAVSMKHLIKRNTYTQTVELTTDSFSKKVRGS